MVRHDVLTSISRNQARLLTGVLACNLLHMLGQFYLLGEDGKRSMESLIKRLIRIRAKVAVTVAGGNFMWRRPSPWPGTTELCLAEKLGGKNG